MNNDEVQMLGLLVPLAIGGVFIFYVLYRQQQSDLKKKKARDAELAAIVNRWAELAGPDGLLIPYDGGHPELPAPEQIAMKRSDAGIAIVNFAGKAISIPFRSITGIAFNANVQRVNTGGGRSVQGAIVGHMLFGNIGAIVGGQAPTRLQIFDESRTVITIKYGTMNAEVTFKSDREIHAKIAGMLANPSVVVEA